MNENRKLRSALITQQSVLQKYLAEDLMRLEFYDSTTKFVSSDGEQEVSARVCFTIFWGQQQMISFIFMIVGTVKILHYANTWGDRSKTICNLLESLKIPSSSTVILRSTMDGTIEIRKSIIITKDDTSFILPEKVCIAIFNKVICVLNPPVMEVEPPVWDDDEGCG